MSIIFKLLVILYLVIIMNKKNRAFLIFVVFALIIGVGVFIWINSNKNNFQNNYEASRVSSKNNVNESSKNDDSNNLNSNTSNTSNATNTSNTSNSRNTSNSVNSTNTSTTNSSTTNTNSITVQGGLPESDLGISNILSIILIAIGVLLILLAIAILIRLGK